jgi:hypothetical protein
MRNDVVIFSKMAETSEQQHPGLAERPRRMPSDHLGVLIAALLMMLGGWGGLALLIQTKPPRIGSELWGFFVLLHFAVTGTVLPFVRYINVRLTLSTVELPPGGIIVRQSVWIGLYAVICAWLQILRALSLPIAFFLALVFVVLEGFLRMRELNDEDL